MSDTSVVRAVESLESCADAAMIAAWEIAGLVDVKRLLERLQLTNNSGKVPWMHPCQRRGNQYCEVCSYTGNLIFSTPNETFCFWRECFPNVSKSNDSCRKATGKAKYRPLLLHLVGYKTSRDGLYKVKAGL